MAAQFADLLWPIFLLLGVERVMISPGATAVTPLDFISYPLSHSLLANLGWACLFAGVYKVVKRGSGGAVCVWFVVMSHWLLDALSHRPDLPLYPGSSTYVGFGLWNSRGWTFLIEVAIFLVGARIYSRATRPRDPFGSLAFRSYVALLFLIYLISIFGPPPPGERAVAFGALGLWVFVFWAYFLDRHRVARSPHVQQIDLFPPPDAPQAP